MSLHIIILHGWSISESNQEKWQPFIDQLRQLNFTVDFLKLPGLSTKIDQPWTLDDYITWLHQELATFEKPIVLLGHSFGGQLAIKYVARFQSEVSHLVLIDSAGIRDTSVLAMAKRSVFYWLAKIGKQFVSHDFFRQFLYKIARETDYYKADTIMRQTMANVLDDEVKLDLPNISTQTLIIWGRQDRVTPLSLSHLFNQGIKDSQLVTIDEARHSPQFTHSQEVVSAIDSFLTKAPAQNSV